MPFNRPDTYFIRDIAIKVSPKKCRPIEKIVNNINCFNAVCILIE